MSPKSFQQFQQHTPPRQRRYNWRFYFLCALLLLILACLIWRIVDLGVLQRAFLLKESASRCVRDIEIPSSRGKIYDRNGELLATNVPVDSVWANPQSFKATPTQWQQLAQILGMSLTVLKNKLSSHVVAGVSATTANALSRASSNLRAANNSASRGDTSGKGKGDKPNKGGGKVKTSDKREFIYLKRHVSAEVADKIKALHIPSLFLQQEYQRYYPDAEVTAQILGLTNVDNKGQEGLELAYDSWLRGTPGKQRILQDRLGNIVNYLAVKLQPQVGRDLTLSLDRRIQYIAYQELKSAVTKYQAESGIVVVMVVKTGEILAMISLPTCDSNKRDSMSNPACYKNRAVTDLFEPGSTIKTFSVANALESGQYTKDTLVDTNPGSLKVENHVIYDDEYRNNGVLTVTGVLQKSSDIGVTKITLSLPPESLLDLLKRVGFGRTTQSGFPGEATGVLPAYLKGRPLMLATIAYGYGISTTALQLARAYTAIANGGVVHAVSFLKLNKTQQVQQVQEGLRVISQKISDQVLTMLQSVLELGGTGRKARIQGYSVAGKTGTSRIAKPHGYYRDRHAALFVGIAPASKPELVAVVVINNPRGLYHGGSVAAPVFANVMQGALRILSIPPDTEQEYSTSVNVSVVDDAGGTNGAVARRANSLNSVKNNAKSNVKGNANRTTKKKTEESIHATT